MIHNKRVPSIDGMEIDKAHKGGVLGDVFGGGGGGGFGGILSSADDMLKNPFDYYGVTHDPAGLFYQSKNQNVLALQGMADIGGFGAQKTINAQIAEKAKQDALAAEMEARRLAASAQPLEERAKLNYNQSAFGSGLGSLGLIVDTQATKRSASTGLGGIDKASAGLGFGSKSKVGK